MKNAINPPEKQTPSNTLVDSFLIENNLNNLNELINYKFIIDNYAKNKENTSFSNSSKEHAAIVLSTIFKYAEETICVFDKNLIKDTFIKLDNEMQDNIVKFLKKPKAKLDIVLQYKLTPNEENKNILSILNEYSEKVTIKFASPDFIERFTTPDENTNESNLRFFTIADERMFRIKLTSENYEQAICNFGNEEISKEYCDEFNKMFEGCTNYNYQLA